MPKKKIHKDAVKFNPALNLVDHNEANLEITPWQCGHCEEMFARLNTYTYHSNFITREGRCPTHKEMTKAGLYQDRHIANGKEYQCWFFTLGISEADMQEEVLDWLKKKFDPEARMATYQQNPTFDQMAESSHYQLLTKEQIENYQQAIGHYARLQPFKQKEPNKFEPRYHPDWRERLEAPAKKDGSDKPFWMGKTWSITEILQARLKANPHLGFDDVALTATEWNDLTSGRKQQSDFMPKENQQ